MTKTLRTALWALLGGAVVVNGVVALHAWRFTHYGPRGQARTGKLEQLSRAERAWVLLTGYSNPKPENLTQPDFPFENVQFTSANGQLAAWYGAVPAARGTVVVCHGYTSSRAKFLPEAAAFRQLGYAVLVLDFSGSGESAGYQVTIGYREAADVVAAAAWVRARTPAAPLVLYGASMGAVAILRAEAELGLQATLNILECPYGSMLQTARNRFVAMRVPPWPLANLLVFWGSVENGYWAFDLRGTEYARRVATPTLLMWGEADPRVTRAETDSVFAHLAGPKERVDFAEVGHESYLLRQPERWRAAVSGWLDRGR